jgi:hypothetical protein
MDKESISKIEFEILHNFEVIDTKNGFMVVTPMKWDDGDNVVVFADAINGNGWRVTDDGESAFRLSLDYIGTKSECVKNWLAEHSPLVGWNNTDKEIEVTVSDKYELVPAIFMIAQAALQMQAFASLCADQGIMNG